MPHPPSSTTADGPPTPLGRRSAPLRIAAGYLLAGLAWVWASDAALYATGAQPAAGFLLSGAKGSLFFLATAPPLFWLVRRDLLEVTRANALLAAVAEGTTDAVFVKDRAGRYLLFNTAAARLVGKPVAEVLGRDDTAVFEPDSARRARATDRAVMEAGEALTAEERLTAAGVERTYQATKAPLRDDRGAVVGVIGISRDVTDRVAAAAAVRESEARLRDAQRIARIGSWAWEPGSGRVWWSEAIYDLFGVPVTTEPCLDSFLALLHPDDLSAARARVAAVMAGADGFADDLRIVRPDGRVVWVRSEARATRDEAGRLLRMEGFDQDITDRKLAEEAVRESEARYRTLVDNSSDAILLHGDDGVITDANAAAARMLGTSRDALIGASPRAFDPDATPARMAAIMAALDAGESLAFDTTHHRADGTTFPVEVRIRPFWAGGRRLSISTVRDITDRKRAAEALRESEERLRLALEAARLGVWEVRLPDGDRHPERVNHWDEAYGRLFGLTPDQLPRAERDFFALVHPDDRAAVAAAFERCAAGEADYVCEFRIIRPDGQVRWHSANGRLVRDAAGNPQRVTGVGRDVTDRKLAEDRLRASEERYRLLFEAHPHPMWVYDRETLAFLAVNDAAVARYGYARDEFLGMTIADIRPPEDVPALRAAVAAVSGGYDESGVWRHRLKDGRVIRVRITSHGVTFVGRPAEVILAQDVTAQLAAEEALRASEARARRDEALLGAVMDALPESVIIADQTGRLVRMNPASQDIWGPAPMSEDVAGYREYVGYLPGSGRRVEPHEWPMARAVLAGETTTGFQVEIERFGGGRRHLVLSAAPVVADDGTRLGGVVACADVTARVAAEAALRRSEERLDQAVRAAGFGVYDHDHRAGELYWSPRLREIYGVGQTAPAALDAYLAMIHPDDRAVIAAAVRRAHDPTGDGRFDVEHRLVRVSDGRVRWLSTRSQTTFDGEGPGRRLSRTVGAVLDVTADREAEAALRESEWRFRQVFEHAATGIGITDADGRFLQCNPAYCAVLGLTEEELRAADLAELIHPDDRAENMALLRRLAAGEIDRYEVENRFLHKSGEPRWVYKWVTSLDAGSGRATCLMALVTDVTERRRAEHELRDREERLRLAVRAANVGLWDWDVRTDRVLFSPEWKAQLGYAPDEVADTLAEWESRVHPDDLGPAVERVARTLAGPDDGHETEFRMRHKDGSWRWIFTRAEVVRDAAGAAVRMLGGHLDVTDRRRGEEALRASEERYRRLVEVLPEAVFINADDRVAYCNPACVALFGAADAAALVGRSPFDLFAPEYHDAIRGRIRQMRETGGPAVGLDEQIVRLDGRVAPVHVVATPITDRGRDAILVCLRDLSERERALGLLRTVLGSVGDAILTIDTRGRVETANPATERLFGYAEAELVGRNVSVLMPEPDRGRHDGYIANYVRTGEAKVIGTGREVDGRRKDGTTFPVELTVTEFRLDGQRRFTGVLRDITARRRLEEQFRQAQKMEAVGRLAGGVAHDFNNLLTVINGYTDLLLSDLPPDAPQRGPVSAVRDAGERAAALTAQLLAFSRKAIVAPKEFDLKDVAVQSEKLLRRLIGEDVVLALVLHPAPCPVRADPNQVDQVIMNLAVNARDAMPTGGRLTLEVRPVAVADGGPAAAEPGVRPGRYVELKVTDTGSGMPPEVQARIFEPFFTTKGEGKGTGLGLATVFGIVSQAGGHVSVASAAGRGTTFRVLLPEVPGTAAGAEPVRPAASRGTEVVLLVEDDAAVRRLSQLALETQGYRVLAAAGGREALDLLRARPDGVDVVVTDVVMPEMSGRQLADAVRSAYPGTRVLFVSGYTDDAVVRHGVRDAADAFLQKPFTPLGLARKVREVLDAG